MPRISRAFLIGLQVVGARVSPPLDASLQPAAWAGLAREKRATRLSATSAAAAAKARKALKAKCDSILCDGLIPNSLVGLRG